MKTSVNAYAKINLFLDMVSRRDDGYHNILSVMQSVTLHDVVTVEYTAGESTEITITCNADAVPADQSNLGYKAATRFPYANGIINIHIDKNIPVSAGLAGGSADAAAVLLALNELCGNPMTLDELKDLGATLGADVPFCIECGTRLVEGIGDKISDFAPMPNYPIVIAKKGEGMSTPAAYRMLDERFDNFSSYTPHKEHLSKLTQSNSSDIYSYCSGIYNLFEQVVEPLRADVTLIKKTMNGCGAINTTMSGSGTSVFGIFNRAESAEVALLRLKDLGADAHICYPYNSR